MKYNLLQVNMPIFEGKKIELVGVKVNQKMLDEFGKISKDLDRPMSYVVRELALRGLAQFKRDGNLKMTSDDEQVFSQSDFIAVENKGQLSDEFLEKRKTG